MFGDYIATKKDLQTVEKALDILWNSKLDYIFKYKERIKEIPVISFDSKYIYLWKREANKYKLSKFLHNIKNIDDSKQKVWMSGIYIEEIKNILKKETGMEINGPCGGLLTPFTRIHKKYSHTSSDPYFTKESYYATILHEFGHIYWNSFKLWWPSDQKENINFLKTVKMYYVNNNKLIKTNITLPNPKFVTEIFAFCAEYSASKLFWPKHIKNFDKFAVYRIEKMISVEKTKDLNTQDSSLEANINPHDHALVAGKSLLTQFPKNWVSILIKPLKLN